jgi:hypothetical protein
VSVHDPVIRDGRGRAGVAEPLVADVRSLGVADVHAVLTRHAPPRHGLREGRRVAGTTTTSDVVVPEPIRAAAAGGRRPDPSAAQRRSRHGNDAR